MGANRITVNLAPSVSKILDKHGRATGESKTDTVNRAIPMYAWINERIQAGDVLVMRGEGAECEIKIF